MILTKLLQILTEQPKKKSRDLTSDFDEDHALDLAMNDMVKDMDIQDFEDLSATINDGLDDLDDFTENDVRTMFERNDEDLEPVEALKGAALEWDGAVSFDPDAFEKSEEPIDIQTQEEKSNLATFVKKAAKSMGLSGQTIENRLIKKKPVVKTIVEEEDPIGNRRGPLYAFRMDKSKTIDEDGS